LPARAHNYPTPGSGKLEARLTFPLFLLLHMHAFRIRILPLTKSGFEQFLG